MSRGGTAPRVVLHLITELNVGGAQTMLLRLLQGTDRRQISPIVACFYNGDKVMAQQIQALDIEVVDLGITAGTHIGGLLRLIRLLRARRPQVLHCWLYHANLTGRIAGRLANVPAIVTSRHSLAIGGTGRERIMRSTRGLDDAVIAVSDAVRAVELTRTGSRPEKVVTIYGGIDPTHWQPDGAIRRDVRADLGYEPAQFLLLTVGRLVYEKGIDVLLQAWPGLTAHLLVVGDGPERSALVKQAAALGVADRVRFAGARQDVAALMNAADVFVLPSRWEGVPMVALEAMATALPVVATAVGGVPEAVVDGLTGLLVPPEDPAALAGALRTLQRDPVRRASMGAAGRARILARFTLDNMVTQTVALYDDVLIRKHTHG